MSVTPEQLKEAADLMTEIVESGLYQRCPGDTYFLSHANQLRTLAGLLVCDQAEKVVEAELVENVARQIQQASVVSGARYLPFDVSPVCVRERRRIEAKQLLKSFDITPKAAG